MINPRRVAPEVREFCDRHFSRPKIERRPGLQFKWTDARIAELRRLALKGATRKKCGELFGVSIDAIVGAANRYEVDFSRCERASSGRWALK